MHTDKQSRVAIDTTQPVNAPLVGFKLFLAKGSATKFVKLPAFWVYERVSLILQPTEVMKNCPSHHRIIGVRRRKVLISPVRSKLAHQTRVIGLTNENKFAIILLSDKHG